MTSQKGYTIALRLPLVTISVTLCNLLFIDQRFLTVQRAIHWEHFFISMLWMHKIKIAEEIEALIFASELKTAVCSKVKILVTIDQSSISFQFLFKSTIP